MDPSYILVTPVKDEEDNLPVLIESIVSQNLRPTAWFIVDDASEDRSSQIINEASSEHSGIHSLKLDVKHAYDIGEHYAFVCAKGFDYALDYCEQNNIHFEYIALSDADMIYPEDYFAKCINFLHDNRQFGIVSGRVLIKDKIGDIYEEDRIRLGDGQPYGTGRVWRKKAFVDTGGYLVAKSPDTVSNVKALLGGWKIKRLLDIACYQTRDTGGKNGLWSGYFNKGKRSYYLNVNPLSVLNVPIGLILISREKNSMTKSLAFFCGYFQSFIRREDQIENDEVKRYIGSYKRVIRHYWLFLKGLAVRRRNHEK